jgi:transcriptional regulator with XRE-family HTH domain
MTKYGFIKQRLKEIGKTQKELAKHLGIETTHINVLINKDIREVQTREISLIAEFLKIDRINFLDYVSGKTTNIIYEENKTEQETTNQSTSVEPTVINRSILFEVIASLEEFLSEESISLPADKKARLIEILYDLSINSTDTEQKKNIKDNIVNFIRLAS